MTQGAIGYESSRGAFLSGPSSLGCFRLRMETATRLIQRIKVTQRASAAPGLCGRAEALAARLADCYAVRKWGKCRTEIVWRTEAPAVREANAARSEKEATMRALKTCLAITALLLSHAASAAWKSSTVDGITVRSQAQPGSAIREFSAEATLKAPLEEIQSALLDIEAHASFMPYVVEAKDLGAVEAGGARLAYSRLEFPLVRSRDFILRITVDRALTAEGGNEFANHWVSVPTALAERPGVIRIRLNEGSWRATRISPAETRVVYRFRVDPAGWIPSVFANEASRRAIPSVFRALEREAQHRAATKPRTARSAEEGAQSGDRTPGVPSGVVE